VQVVGSTWRDLKLGRRTVLVALWGQNLGNFVHLDEGMFRVVEVKFSDEVEEDLVEWLDKSVKIWCGFAALGEAELMSSVETLTMDSAGRRRQNSG
jgi:hypothetical protein